MPIEQLNCKWAKIAQLKALPILPSQMEDLGPEKVREKISRMFHKEKVREAKHKYAC
jgi:hypothetical protein